MTAISPRNRKRLEAAREERRKRVAEPGIVINAQVAAFAFYVVACCALQPAKAEDPAEHKVKFLSGRLEEAGSQNSPLNSFDPDLTDLAEEQPLPDYIVKRYIEPLIWVKIPKGFAGVWETRYFGGPGLRSGRNEMFARQNTESTVIKNGKVRHQSIEAGEEKAISERNEMIPPLDYSVEDHYRFCRGLQIDENGDIWDCPSIRNVQFHKEIDGSCLTDRVHLYSDESLKIVSDKMISESKALSISGITASRFQSRRRHRAPTFREPLLQIEW